MLEGGGKTGNKKQDKEKNKSDKGDKEKKDKEKDKMDPADDIRNYDFPIGFGNAYVEFTSVIEAKRARRNIHLLKYNKKTVECEYHDEHKFMMNDFTRL